MTGPLDDALAKLDWAKRHIHILKAEIRAGLDAEGDPPVFGLEFESDSSRYILYAKHVPPLPIGISLTVGDILHNLRSALDYLAWQLVLNGSEPNPAKPNLVQFPIYSAPDAFAAMIEARLPGVDTAKRDAIEALQPHQANEAGNVLGRLANASNDDKHRLIPVILTVPADLKVEPRATGCRITEVSVPKPRPALEDGAPLIAFTIELLPGSTGHKMHMDSEVTVAVAFEDGAIVDDSLELAAATVEGILRDPVFGFEPI